MKRQEFENKYFGNQRRISMKELMVAKEIVEAYFSHLADKDSLSYDGLAELFLIKNDTRVLLQHLKAINTIFEKAIKELENGE